MLCRNPFVLPRCGCRDAVIRSLLGDVTASSIGYNGMHSSWSANRVVRSIRQEAYQHVIVHLINVQRRAGGQWQWVSVYRVCGSLVILYSSHARFSVIIWLSNLFRRFRLCLRHRSVVTDCSEVKRGIAVLYNLVPFSWRKSSCLMMRTTQPMLRFSAQWEPRQQWFSVVRSAHFCSSICHRFDKMTMVWDITGLM